MYFTLVPFPQKQQSTRVDTFPRRAHFKFIDIYFPEQNKVTGTVRLAFTLRKTVLEREKYNNLSKLFLLHLTLVGYLWLLNYHNYLFWKR